MGRRSPPVVTSSVMSMVGEGRNRSLVGEGRTDGVGRGTNLKIILSDIRSIHRIVSSSMDFCFIV